MWYNLRYRLNKNVVCALGIIVVTLLISVITAVSIHVQSSKPTIITIALEPLTYSNTYTAKPKYTDYTVSSFSSDSVNVYTAISKEETVENFTANVTESNFEQLESSTATGTNQKLFEIADSNFIVYYGNQRVNPVFPLALANVETPGRANHSITWSALFPSRIVPIELLETMDVTTVISNPDYYKALSAEYSTRDRGALQMSPTYGTGIKEINAKMSGTEKDKLSKVNTQSYSNWVSGASDSPGDRFKVSDVCLRLSGSMSQGISFIIKNDYIPTTDMQLIAMCAMHHHSSGVWYWSDKNKPVGKWVSGNKAYEWSSIVSSDAMLKALSDYAKANPDKLSIDSNTAKQIYSSVYNTPMSSYASNTIVCTYPIKVLYAYIKLCMLYTS